MKLLKNKLDEMQEQKLLSVESAGFWIAFLGLLISSVVQCVIGVSFTHIADNLILIMVLSVYVWIRCYKYGIWGRFLAPNAKTNVIMSLVAGIVVGFMNYGTFTYFEWPKEAAIKGGVISAIGCFVLCLVMQTISLMLYKHRRKKLDGE